jgi:hypothetical protein
LTNISPTHKWIRKSGVKPRQVDRWLVSGCVRWLRDDREPRPQAWDPSLQVNLQRAGTVSLRPRNQVRGWHLVEAWRLVMPCTQESCNYGVANVLQAPPKDLPQTRRDWSTLNKWKGRLPAPPKPFCMAEAYHQPPYESALNGAFAAGQQ